MRKLLRKLLFWLQQVLISIDQFANALLGGWADETLSSCAYRMERAGRPWGRITRPLIDALFFFQPDHCRIAFECERQRVQAPPETR